MLKGRGDKKTLLLTFASSRGEVTGRLPTEAQNKEGDTERVGRAMGCEREWEHKSIYLEFQRKLLQTTQSSTLFT